MNSILLLPEDVDALQSQASRDLHDDLRRGWHAKAVIAGVRQTQIATAFRQADPIHNEALGQLIGVVEPWIYEEMRRLHGERCWRDPEFKRMFFKMNPQAAIRSRSAKVSLRVQGLKGRTSNTQHPTPNIQSGKLSAGACTETGGILCP